MPLKRKKKKQKVNIKAREIALARAFKKKRAG